MQQELVVREWDGGNIGVRLGDTEYVMPAEKWDEIFDKIQELRSDRQDEDRANFLTHVNHLIDYWDELPEVDQATGHKHTQKDRIEGVVFSLLVLLDGGSNGMYCVRRCITDGETGEVIDYGPDIAGSLHELLGNYAGKTNEQG